MTWIVKIWQTPESFYKHLSVARIWRFFKSYVDFHVCLAQRIICQDLLLWPVVRKNENNTCCSIRLVTTSNFDSRIYKATNQAPCRCCCCLHAPSFSFSARTESFHEHHAFAKTDQLRISVTSALQPALFVLLARSPRNVLLPPVNLVYKPH